MVVGSDIPEAAEHLAEYELRVDFALGSQDPARIFEAMAGMIGAFDEFDAHLAASISTKRSKGDRHEAAPMYRNHSRPAVDDMCALKSVAGGGELTT